MAGLASIAALLLLLVLSPQATTRIAQYAGERLSNMTGLKLTIRNIDIPLFGNTLRLHDLLLAGADGRPWFAVDKVEIDIDTGELTRGKLIIPEVRISGVQGGVMVLGDDAWPVDDLLRVIRRLTKTEGSSNSKGSFPVSIGPIYYQNTRGYFMMDDPPMFVQVPSFGGQVTIVGGDIEVYSHLPPFTYTLFDWPVRVTDVTAVTTIKGDIVTVRARLHLDDKVTDLWTSARIHADNGEVQLHAWGTVQSGLVNRYFSSYPHLQGGVQIEASLAVTDSFSLAATLQARTLQLQKDLLLHTVQAAIHMTDEQIWIDHVGGSFASGGHFSLAGTLPFSPKVTLDVEGSARNAPVKELVRNFAGQLKGIALSGRYSGGLAARVRVGEQAVRVESMVNGALTSPLVQLKQGRYQTSTLQTIVGVDVRVPKVGDTQVDLEINRIEGKDLAVNGKVHVDGHGVTSTLWARVSQDLLRQIAGEKLLKGGTLDLEIKGSSPRFLIKFDGQQLIGPLYTDPLSLTGKIITAGDVVTTEGLRLFSESGMFIGGEVTFFRNRDLWQFNLNGRDLPLSHIGGVGASGQLRGTFTGSWDQQRREFYSSHISLTAQNLQLPQWQVGDSTLLLEGNRLHLTLGGGRIFGTLLTDHGYSLQVTVSDIPLSPTGTLPSFAGILRGKLSAYMTTAATLTASGSLRVDQLSLKGAGLGSAVGGFEVQVPHGQVYNAVGKASVSLFGAGNTVAAAIDHGRDTTLLWLYTDAPKGGKFLTSWPSGEKLDLAGTGLLAWRKDTLTKGWYRVDRGGATSRGYGVSLAEGGNLRVESGKISATNLVVDLTDPAGKTFRQWIDFHVNRQMYWGISGKLDFPLSLVQIALPFLRVSDGTVRGHFSLTGGKGAPDWQGELHLSPAQIIFTDLGLRQQLQGGSIVARGRRWRLNEIRMTNEEGGKTVLNGELRWKGWIPEGDLSIRVDRTRIIPIEGFVARLTGRLGLSLRAKQPIRVQGELNLDNAVYSRRFDWELSLLKFQKRDVIRLDEVVGPKVLLNIIVHNDRRLRIRNNLADVRIGGDIHLVGSVSHPGITGNLQVLGGTLFWRGVAYNVRNALFQFVDPKEINPVVDLEAVATVPYYDPEGFGSLARQDYEILFKAYGPLRSLQMQFSSTPTLSQIDILSLLNFGVLSNRLSGGAGGTSQVELTNLVLGAQIARFEEEIQDLIGFDRFELRPSFNRGSEKSTLEIAMEKRIGDRLRLRLASSVDSVGEQSFGLDYNLSNYINVTLGWDNQTDVQIGNFSLQPSLRFPLP